MQLRRITPEELPDLLGPPRFKPDVSFRTSRPGVATGVAWTETGGDVLFVEATLLPAGKGQIILTGQLGNVMQESARAALSHIRANADERRGDWAKGLDVYAVNYLRALTSDRDWPTAERRLQDLLDQEHLEPTAIARTLAQTMPRYAGEHTGVLTNADLLRDLERLLG